MRAAIKLSAILLLALIVQCTLVDMSDPLDEAEFQVRMFIAYLQGDAMDDPENVDYAVDMMRRRWERQELIDGMEVIEP
jgi:hypothetical protein